MLASLREALAQLGDLGDVEVSVDVGALGSEHAEDPDGLGGPPDVTVVDGGRERGAPRVPRPRPELRVADGMTSAGEGSPEEPSVRPRRTIRVVRVNGDTTTARGGGRSAPVPGRIRVAAGARQALYRGGAVRPYRVGCDEGSLAVSVDGEPHGTVLAGQTLDVEGREVEVEAAGDGAATGSYGRLA